MNFQPKGIIPAMVTPLTSNRKINAAQYRLAPLRLAFDLGTFPVVIKEALNLIGIEAGVGMPPVGGMKPETKAELKEILKNMGLL
jgi:4-hydroxy-tetrahydrodipicolinate synthase